MKGNFDGPFDIVVFTRGPCVKPKAVDSNMMKLFDPFVTLLLVSSPISLVLRFKTSLRRGTDIIECFYEFIICSGQFCMCFIILILNFVR